MKELKVKDFGLTCDGRETKLYTLENDKGMKVSLTDFGGAIVSIIVPDKDGNFKDVVLGYDDAAGYERGTASFGAPVGRHANRIGTASFEINGVHYELTKNDNDNNLHSGTNYYNKRIWTVEEKDDTQVTFTLHSPHNDQGFPGTLDMHVNYYLTEDGALEVRYYAVPDKDTIINMTNHSYFNLNGHTGDTVLNHEVTINADYFTRATDKSIPTGELVDVTDTVMDFRKPVLLSKGIDSDYEATRFGCGYDHNWVLKNNGKFDKVACAVSKDTGIGMEVWTDLPGMQMYTANFLDGEQGKDGAVYERRSAVCFETQYFPDAVHHDNFPSPIVKAQEAYKTKTVFKFFIAE